MYIVDLHYKTATVESALYNLNSSLKLARSSKEKILCVIVGYGSSGGSHKIKNAVIEELNNLLNKKQIKGFIGGNEIDIFNVKYQLLKGKESIPKELHQRKNPGEVIIIL